MPFQSNTLSTAARKTDLSVYGFNRVLELLSRGLSIGLMLITGFILIAVVGGATRAAFHSVELPYAFCISSVLVLALLAYISPRSVFRFFSLSPRDALLFTAVVGGLLFLFLKTNSFRLPNIGNADAGFHIEYMRAFAAEEPGAYHGFVGFYAVTLWLKQIFDLNHYQVHLLSLSLGFLLVSGTFFFTTFKLLLPDDVRFLHAVILAVLLSLAGALIVLPVYNEFVIQGGYVHAFGCIVYPIAALLYALGSSPIRRLLALIIGVVGLRFSYGLNLGDLMVIAAVLSALEIRGEKKLWTRVIAASLAVLFSIGAVRSYLSIWTILDMSGAATEIELWLIWFSFLVMAVTLFVFMRWGLRLTLSVPVKRLLLFCALMLVVTTGMQVLFYLLGQQMSYYMFKYTVYSALLTVAAGVGVACSMSMLGLGSVSRVGWLSCSGMLVALILLFIGYRPYFLDSYGNRTYSLVAFDEWEAVEQTLAQSGKRLGGYITHDWPRFHYVNHAFGHSVDWEAYKNGDVRLEPGFCVFWPIGKKRVRLAGVMQVVHGQAHRVAQKLEAKYEVLLSNPSTSEIVGFFPGLRLHYLCL